MRWREGKPEALSQTGVRSIPLESANWQLSSSQSSEALEPVRTVSHEQASSAFESPFGDQVAQSRKSTFETPDAASPAEPARPEVELPSLEDLLPPEGPGSQAAPPADGMNIPELPGADALELPPAEAEQPAPPLPLDLPFPAQPAEPKAAPAAPRPSKVTPGTEEAQPPLQTPAPYLPSPTPTLSGRAESDCKRIYNDRDCCQEEESCNAARLALKQNTIKKISLDITASFKPDAKTIAEADEAESDQLRLMPSRVWKDRTGQVLADGRVVDVHNRRIVVEQADGTAETIRLGQLGDDELCFLAAYWRVPTECTLGDEVYVQRNWQPQTFTWTASALCHKPLYFEERQLERYGHTPGPIIEPVLSGAHFFLNVAVLPYKMGMNTPNECQYVLGYYRPGSCAPWLLPPVPISVRGGLFQAGAVTGLTFLVP